MFSHFHSIHGIQLYSISGLTNIREVTRYCWLIHVDQSRVYQSVYHCWVWLDIKLMLYLLLLVSCMMFIILTFLVCCDTMVQGHIDHLYFWVRWILSCSMYSVSYWLSFPNIPSTLFWLIDSSSIQRSGFVLLRILHRLSLGFVQLRWLCWYYGYPTYLVA